MTTARTAPVADPYSRLGLSPGAPITEVRRAYRHLAMRYHPDRAGSAKLETFLAVKAAYEWIVAHPSFSEPGDRRPGEARATAGARRVRRSRPMAARPAPSASGRASWPGGRWYWEGIRERASRRGPDD